MFQGIPVPDDDEQSGHQQQHGRFLRPAAQQRVEDVPSVELADRDQIQRSDQQSDPAGERHRIEEYYVARGYRAMIRAARNRNKGGSPKIKAFGEGDAVSRGVQADDEEMKVAPARPAVR